MSSGIYRDVIAGVAAIGLFLGTLRLSGNADSLRSYGSPAADTVVVDSVQHSPEYKSVFPDYYTRIFSGGREYTIRGKMSVGPGDSVEIRRNGRPRIIR